MDELFAKNAIQVEPTADMRQAGLGLRQMFLANTEAGFSEVQAMQLVIAMLANSSNNDK